MKSYKVRIWGIDKNAAGNPRVRWRVAGQRHSEVFTFKTLADSFRSVLVSAARAGEAFDIETGLPASMAETAKAASEPWFDHAVRYVAKKWTNFSPNSRVSTAEAMATVTPALTRKTAGRPTDEQIRTALYGWAFNLNRPADQRPAEVVKTLTWLRKASRAVAELAEEPDLVYAALDALTKKQDGERAAANTIRRKRAVFYNALGYAVERKLLAINPLDQIQWSVPKVEHEVDPRVVPSAVTT